MLGRLTAAVIATPSDDGADFVRAQGGRPAAARLRVYEEMYYLRLREALEAYFPKVAQGLGDAFDDVARQYLSQHPSRHPSLRHLGDALPDFLASATCPAVVDRPWLASLARLELARLDVFDAIDEPSMTRVQLATRPPEGFAALPIGLVAAHRVLALDWDAPRLFADPNDAVAQRCAVLVARRGVAVYQRRLDELEAELLGRLVTPTPFANVCEWIAERVGEGSEADVGCALLARWVDDQLLTARLG
jgi:hypothetical protein